MFCKWDWPTIICSYPGSLIKLVLFTLLCFFWTICIKKITLFFKLWQNSWTSSGLKVILSTWNSLSWFEKIPKFPGLPEMSSPLWSLIWILPRPCLTLFVKSLHSLSPQQPQTAVCVMSAACAAHFGDASSPFSSAQHRPFSCMFSINLLHECLCNVTALAPHSQYRHTHTPGRQKHHEKKEVFIFNQFLMLIPMI